MSPSSGSRYRKRESLAWRFATLASRLPGLRLSAMVRKSSEHWMRIVIAVSSWIAAVTFLELAAETEIGRTARQLEERIELELRMMERFRGPEIQPPAPERSHEESIEPWELVGV